MLRGGKESEDHLERVESAYALATFVARLLAIPRSPALVPAGLAQSRQRGPLDKDADIEAQLQGVRDSGASSPAGQEPEMSVPARMWMAVGGALLLWGIIAAILALTL